MTVLRSQILLMTFLGVAVVCLGVFTYDEITRQAVDDVIKTLIAFITGAVGAYLSNDQGVRSTQQTQAQTKNGGTPSASP